MQFKFHNNSTKFDVWFDLTTTHRTALTHGQKYSCVNEKPILNFTQNFSANQIVLMENKTLTIEKERLMPCPFTSPKMFCAGPNLLCQTKNVFTYCGSHKHFVPDKKMICIQ